MKKQYSWFVIGDLDGFFALMIDNLIQLLVLVYLLTNLCGFPSEFVYAVVLPGAAISLLIGNLFYAYQAHRLARLENRADVTALPYGINTVSLFAFVFFIVFPVYRETSNYIAAWQAGILACFLSGLIEIIGSLMAEKIRRATPRAALLSSLAGIAITFISMDFLVRTFQNPIVGFIPFAIILLQYFGRIVFPFRIPGGLVAVLAGTTLAWCSPFWGGEAIMNSEAIAPAFQKVGIYLPQLSIGPLWETLTWENIQRYFSVILPMGIFNVIGSLQNIESAEASGDKYPTRPSMLANGIGSVVGSMFGSPFPTTIYIGHPGWKALGARAGYSTLNGVFITCIASFGMMEILQSLVPIEAGMAIVLWVGIVIASQSFQASPTRHAPAIIIGLLPALAGWGILLVQNVFQFAENKLQGILKELGQTSVQAHIWMSEIPERLEFLPYAMEGMLSLNQGFLLTSMIWGSLTVFVIDRDFRKACFTSIFAVILSLAGLIHAYSLEGNQILNRFQFPPGNDFPLAYGFLAIFFCLAIFFRKEVQHPDLPSGKKTV